MLRGMFAAALIVAGAVAQVAFATESSGTKEFRAGAGGNLTLRLETGDGAKNAGTGGSSGTGAYKLSGTPDFQINFDHSRNHVRVKQRLVTGSRNKDRRTAR